ncbi:MAG: HAMP domain-containing sensor histidine kinase, partial [Alphaproteobacteria bacterium]
PLNAVIGFADVMLARSFGPVNERQAQYLQDIANAGRHMLDMVDHMLDHAQLTAGAYPIQPEWCLLRAIATEAVRLLAPAASAGEVELVLEPLPDLEVYVDRRSLLQVLINLLGNAVKFTPAGGRVALSAERASDALHIVVADTGEGIAEADLDRVREPFTQARRLGGRPLKGAGLGLAIVSAIAELHESEVTIASTLGDGARVTFKLPLSRTRPHAGDAR